MGQAPCCRPAPAGGLEAEGAAPAKQDVGDVGGTSSPSPDAPKAVNGSNEEDLQKKKDEAAVKIQKLQRGMSGRLEAAQKKEVKEESPDDKNPPKGKLQRGMSGAKLEDEGLEKESTPLNVIAEGDEEQAEASGNNAATAPSEARKEEVPTVEEKPESTKSPAKAAPKKPVAQAKKKVVKEPAKPQDNKELPKKNVTPDERKASKEAAPMKPTESEGPAGKTKKERSDWWKKLSKAEQNTKGDELRTASGENDAKTVTTLLEEGVNANAADGDGCTALHMAASKGAVGAIELLLKFGGDTTKVMKGGGNTPLHLAAMKGRKEAAQALVSRSDVKTKNGKGKTAGELAKGDLGEWLRGPNPALEPPPWQK